MAHYNNLYAAYNKRYSEDLSKEKIQSNVNDLWKNFKKEKQSFPSNVVSMTKKLLAGKAQKDAFRRLHFFNPQKSFKTCQSLNVAPNSIISMPETSTPTTLSPLTSCGSSRNNKYKCESERSGENGLENNIVVIRKYATPAQDILKAKIRVQESQLCAAVQSRDSGLGEVGVQKKIHLLRRDVARNKKKLISKTSKCTRQKKYRMDQRKMFNIIKSDNPDVAKALRIREKPGRPRVEIDQPELLKAIADIAMFGGGAENRRRSNLIRSCKSLTELQQELEAHDFQISRSATYLRLIPRNSLSNEGKKHVTTVPVKLCRAQADQRKPHIDGKFCTASIKSLEQVISTLGPDQVIVISQDDKSRVPIGLTAANKQAPMLMHLEYKVKLPDHDWVVASKHKLIPSVYAGIKIETGKIGDPKVVSYSGPTYIAIRSAKHSSSTAGTHAFDFQRLLNLESFKDLIYEKNGKVKPVLVIMSDGGPDENPRYHKVISHAIDHFKACDLDALFIITNAPGRSAYNRVERRMAPLSRELAGLILPHDHYGSHLSNACVTVDKDLEKKNFQYAAETLAEVWNQISIDGYPVNAEYVDEESYTETFNTQSAEWYSRHVRESQYLLQIVKCNDRDCCRDWRSNLKDILVTSQGFLPPPFPLRRNDEGSFFIPSPAAMEEKDSFPDFFIRNSLALKPFTSTGFTVPYDFYCPSVRNQITGRTCHLCGAYFASKKQRNIHIKDFHGASSVNNKYKAKKIYSKRGSEVLCELESMMELEWIEEEDVELVFQDEINETESESFPTIGSLHDWLMPLFTEDVSSVE